MNTVSRFSGLYRFLSNFYPCDVVFEHVCYCTVEHAYVAAKTLDPWLREYIAKTPSPGKVKIIGRGLQLRADWEQIKLPLMEGLLRQKFRSGSPLANALLATGEAELIEGNTWGDTFWGVCNGVGENNLGKLLMKIRSELSEQ